LRYLPTILRSELLPIGGGGEYSARAARDRPAGLVKEASAPVYRLLAVHIVAILLMTVSLGFSLEGNDIMIVAVCLGLIVGGAALMRLRRIVRCADALEGTVLILASSMTTACLSVLVATFNAPYVDPWLASADASLFPFLSWPDLVNALKEQPFLTEIMCRLYSTLLWQPFALICILAAINRSDLMWRFLRAWLLTLTAVVIVFAVAPAVTAYVYYGFERAEFPALRIDAGWRPAEIIAQIRIGGIRSLNASNMTGLIAFPSFHAAGATMLAWAFSRVPVIGRPFVLLNGLMLLTIPFIGSHYFVDVVAGIIVAIVAIRASGARGLRFNPVARWRKQRPKSSPSIPVLFTCSALGSLAEQYLDDRGAFDLKGGRSFRHDRPSETRQTQSTVKCSTE